MAVKGLTDNERTDGWPDLHRSNPKQNA